MNTDAYIAIDIGGTYTKLGLVDEAGIILASNKFNTKACENSGEFLVALNTAIAGLIAKHYSKRISGIGLGAPMANYYSGEILQTANLNWKESINIKKYLESAYDTTVAITNDANLAALGEKKFGKGKHLENFLTVTLGTGVGGGIILNNKLYHAKNDISGELGHMTVVTGGRQCGCGKRGCLETYVSASGMVRTAFEMIAREGPERTHLVNILTSGVSAEHIANLAADGDVLAKKIFRQTGKILGQALANLANVLAPEKIFLSGGPINAGALLLDPVVEAFEQHLLSHLRGTVCIDVASHSANEISLLGAVALVMEAQHEIDKINDNTIEKY